MQNKNSIWGVIFYISRNPYGKSEIIKKSICGKAEITITILNICKTVTSALCIPISAEISAISVAPAGHVIKNDSL